MTAGGKAAHVEADLGKNCLRSQEFDAWDGAYLLDGGAKGRNGGLHLPVDLGDGCIDGINLTEMQAQQKITRPCRASRKLSWEALTR